VCDEIAIENGEGRSAAQPAGEYRLVFSGPTLPLTPTDVSIHAAQEALVDVRVEQGALCRLRFLHPDDGWDLRLDLTWLDGSGRMLGRDRLQLVRGRAYVFEQRLAPGRYRLEARAHSGRSAAVELAVDSGDMAPIPVDVSLR
jgi:hypothetical protein